MAIRSKENVEATIFISVTVVSIGIVTPLLVSADLLPTGLEPDAAPPSGVSRGSG